MGACGSGLVEFGVTGPAMDATLRCLELCDFLNMRHAGRACVDQEYESFFCAVIAIRSAAVYVRVAVVLYLCLLSGCPSSSM